MGNNWAVERKPVNASERPSAKMKKRSDPTWIVFRCFPGDFRFCENLFRPPLFPGPGHPPISRLQYSPVLTTTSPSRVPCPLHTISPRASPQKIDTKKPTRRGEKKSQRCCAWSHEQPGRHHRFAPPPNDKTKHFRLPSYSILMQSARNNSRGLRALEHDKCHVPLDSVPRTHS